MQDFNKKEVTEELLKTINEKEDFTISVRPTTATGKELLAMLITYKKKYKYSLQVLDVDGRLKMIITPYHNTYFIGDFSVYGNERIICQIIIDEVTNFKS